MRAALDPVQGHRWPLKLTSLGRREIVNYFEHPTICYDGCSTLAAVAKNCLVFGATPSVQW